jgi:hypothetical protein
LPYRWLTMYFCAADDMSCPTSAFISRHRTTTAPTGESDQG